MQTITHPTSTIVAQATASGQAAVAIVRLSGPEAWSIAERLFRGSPLKPRFAAYGHFIDPWSPEASDDAPVLVDEVLILPFRGPKSFTGEDVVEIHCHGSAYTTRRIIDLCCQAGAELATPGEFTKRAFLNGRLNLTQAEAVLDLIQAEGKALASLACEQLRGGNLTQRLNSLREIIIGIQAEIVASVDYPEEVDEPCRQDLSQRLEQLKQQAQVILSSSEHNRFSREGFKVALLGQPNAGKSSLFNALLNNERAIVTEQAGTTRDVLTETLWIDGIAVTLTDTAGLRDASDKVEKLGVERSWLMANQADAVVFLCPADSLYNLPAGQWPEADAQVLSQIPAEKPLLKLASQVDTLAETAEMNRSDCQRLSVVTGEGVESVLNWLKAQLNLYREQATRNGLAISLNQRQTSCLQAMVDHLTSAKETVQADAFPLDMVTVPLTDALLALDTLEGRDTREEVLDQVFSQFCVGK